MVKGTPERRQHEAYKKDETGRAHCGVRVGQSSGEVKDEADATEDEKENVGQNVHRVRYPQERPCVCKLVVARILRHGGKCHCERRQGCNGAPQEFLGSG